MQNQINLIRDGKFQKQLESLESRFNNLEAKLCKYNNISTTITKLEKSMGEISAIVKQTKETNVKNSNDLKNLKVNLNGVQSKLQSESD
jgi:ribosomal protein L17